MPFFGVLPEPEKAIMEVASKYGLIFETDSFGTPRKWYPNMWSHGIAERMIAGFFSQWIIPIVLKTALLPEIESVMAGEIPEQDFESDPVAFVECTPEQTFFYGSGVGLEDITIPTEDFLAIAKEWLAYLESGEWRKEAND